jgi:hypothetical protein
MSSRAAHGARTHEQLSGAILQYDPMGNVKSIQLDDGVSMTSRFRGPGRPNTRDLSLPAVRNPKILRRKYQYRDGDTGQLLEMKALIVDPVTSGGVVVAGFRVSYNNSLQVGDAQLLGVRPARGTPDTRTTIADGWRASSPPPAPGLCRRSSAACRNHPERHRNCRDDADVQGSQFRVLALDAATTDILTRRGINVAAIDPPGMAATPLAGHKIGSVTPSGGATRTLYYGGKSELIDDGIFLYNYVDYVENRFRHSSGQRCGKRPFIWDPVALGPDRMRCFVIRPRDSIPRAAPAV